MSNMENLIQELLNAFNELDKLMFDEYVDHRLGSPCSIAQIADFEKSIGFLLPPSYHEFLILHNGWDKFDGGAKLLAIEDFQSDWVLKRKNEIETYIFEEEDQTPFDQNMVPILLGEENNFLLLDPNTVKKNGEMDFIAYDFSEEEARFPDFYSFLKSHLESMTRLIDEERNGKKG